MPVYLRTVRCPSCGKAIEGEVADLVFLCDCGVLHTRDDEGTRELEYVIASASDPGAPPSALVYVPFWRQDSEVRIHHKRSEGGFFHRLFGKDSMGGRIPLFMPAVDWDPSTYRQWASHMTSQPPRVYSATSFGPYEHMPVTIERAVAAKLADFLVLTFEAEKPGVLQEISYDVKVLGSSLLYLPFDRSQGRFGPAF